MFRAFWASPDDPYVDALITHSRVLALLGYVHQARLLRDEALAEARRLSPYNWVFALAQAWYGDWAVERMPSTKTLRAAEEILAVSGEQGFSLWLGVGDIMRGWYLSVLGQPAEAIPLLLRGVAMRRATGAKLVMPLFLMALAKGYRIAAQPEEGLERLAEATKLVEITQERWAEAEMHRLRGTLLLCMNSPTAAEDSYQKALVVARQQSAKLWELRAAISLARLWSDQGKGDDARALLAPVYGWFTEGFDTPVLQDAKALLDELA